MGEYGQIKTQCCAETPLQAEVLTLHPSLKVNPHPPPLSWWQGDSRSWETGQRTRLGAQGPRWLRPLSSSARWRFSSWSLMGRVSEPADDLPALPSPCSLSRLSISMFRMEQPYLTFTVMISSFQNKEECAILNLDSRNPGIGRPCIQKFIAKVPVYAHKAQSKVPDEAGAFGSGRFWL